MERRIIIISPDDKKLQDILNVKLDGDTFHIDISKQYAMNKKIENITNGYNDLASHNYVVLFIIGDIIEIFAGKVINDNQISILKELSDFIFSSYKEPRIDFGVFEDKVICEVTNNIKTYDQLLSAILKYRKDDENVRKKI